MKLGKCKDCKEFGPIGGRGLCKKRCYGYHYNNGTLEKFPRLTWKRAELLAEFNLCRARGLSVREAAEKIGVSTVALYRAIQRANNQTQSQPALWDQDLPDRKIN